MTSIIRNIVAALILSSWTGGSLVTFFLSFGMETLALGMAVMLASVGSLYLNVVAWAYIFGDENSLDDFAPKPKRKRP